MIELPARVSNVEAARASHGGVVDRLLPALMRGDPLGDAVAKDFAELGRAPSRHMLDVALGHGIDAVPDAPASLVQLFETLDHVPAWVDLATLRRAGALLFRTGMAGGIVLGAKSLLTGYCSPGGNKPLVFSGQLQRRERLGYRLAETSRFVVDVCREGGMRRFGPGFAATVRVRIMHATVRRLLTESGAYRPELWGVPINQHDMVGTTLLFSLAFLDGARAFGFRFTTGEVEDFLQLWRYNGYVIGVEESLLRDAATQARPMSECIAQTQGEPDDDARALVRAMIESPVHQAAPTQRAQQLARHQVWAGYGFARTLLGEPMADALGLPRTPARFVVPTIRRVLGRVERVGRRVPGYDAKLITAGQQHWNAAIAAGLQGKGATFAPPSSLEGLAQRMRHAATSSR